MPTPDVTATLAKLPPICFYETEEGQTVLITRGEPGYEPITSRLRAADLNSVLIDQPSPEQVVAMVTGSMFGWDKPGADPDVVRAHNRAARGGVL